MAIKISELEELFPYDNYIGEQGVESGDYLPILDVSQADPNLINKKITVAALLQFTAPIDSPSFNGTPLVPFADINENSDQIASTAWVKYQQSNISLNNLTDVEVPDFPLNDRVLTYDVLSQTYKTKLLTGVNRLTLYDDLTLTNNYATYQFLNPGSSNKNVILPAPEARLRFVIKNLDINFSLFIKETINGSTITTLGRSQPKGEFVHDGYQWHIL